MRKKISFWLFAVVTLLTAAYLLTILAQTVNNKRLHLAMLYLQRAQQATDAYQKNLWLIKSDTLAPSANKKISSALIYFSQNQPEKARRALMFVSGSEANYLMAEYYLTTNPKQADYYIQQVSDIEKRDELEQIYRIATGLQEQPISQTNPKTDLGQILLATAQGKLLTPGSSGYLDGLLKNLKHTDNPNDQTLGLASYYIFKGQNNIALYVLNNFEPRASNLPSAYTLKAKAYANLSRYSEAKDWQSKAISLAPEDQTYYRDGIIYANASRDASKAEFWTARLSELTQLQK